MHDELPDRAIPALSKPVRAPARTLDAPPNPLATKLRSGERAFGSFVFSTDPANTEIVGSVGYDFVLIDTEHAPLGIGDVLAHVRAAHGVGTSAVVRVGTLEPAAIARLLDAGAQGIVLPHFGLDLEASEAALAAMRYAPDGTRPTCTGVRSASYGRALFAEYASRANEDTLAIGLVEDAAAVDQIEAVLAGAARLDAVMPGPADLATSLGVPGQQTHPAVVAAVQRVIEAAKALGRLKVGVYVADAALAAAWSQADVDFFVYSIDHRVLVRAYAESLTTLQEGQRGDPRP